MDNHEEKFSGPSYCVKLRVSKLWKTPDYGGQFGTLRGVDDVGNYVVDIQDRHFVTVSRHRLLYATFNGDWEMD